MLRAIQNDLLENPMRGDKIQDVPDALKTRFALKYPGKSYGGRVV